jgi:hypothetical protein
VEPRIERIKTECYFVDVHGVEWKVLDAKRAPQGWREVYPSDTTASCRIFRRLLYRGPASPIPLEMRAYRFRPDDERWFVAEAWQQQLDGSIVRSIRIIGWPPLTDGYLIRRCR